MFEGLPLFFGERTLELDETSKYLAELYCTVEAGLPVPQEVNIFTERSFDECHNKFNPIRYFSEISGLHLSLALQYVEFGANQMVKS